MGDSKGPEHRKASGFARLQKQIQRAVDDMLAAEGVSPSVRAFLRRRPEPTPERVDFVANGVQAPQTGSALGALEIAQTRARGHLAQVLHALFGAPPWIDRASKICPMIEFGIAGCELFLFLVGIAIGRAYWLIPTALWIFAFLVAIAAGHWLRDYFREKPGSATPIVVGTIAVAFLFFCLAIVPVALSIRHGMAAGPIQPAKGSSTSNAGLHGDLKAVVHRHLDPPNQTSRPTAKPDR